jgi:anti-sigma factor RsiW
MAAASIFIILMTGSLFSTWEENHEFSVSKQPKLVVQNNTVIVPEGEIVKGDIVVRNGKIRVEGEVQGDVTVINGEQYVASAGHVTGDIEEVNEAFEWIWYKIKTVFADLFVVINSEIS